MKTFTIRRTSEGKVLCHVKVPNGLYSLFHLVYHSPDGYETGYGGSGPADLALSILADHFKERATQRPAEGRVRCWVLHHQFKDSFIASNKLENEEEYSITEEEILAWLASLEGHADEK